jgi:hypothetical protein
MLDFAASRDYLHDVGCFVEVQGSWWTGCAAADKTKLYLMKVVEYDLNHVFAGARNGKPAVRIVYDDAQLDHATEEAMWMSTSVYDKYLEQYKRAMEQRETMTLAEQLVNAGGTELDVDLEEGSSTAAVGAIGAHGGKSAKFKSVVSHFFERAAIPATFTKTAGSTTKAFTFICKLDGKEVVQFGKPGGDKPCGTGKLSAYLQKYHVEVYTRFVQAKSPYARSRVVDGECIKLYSFRESWRSHVDYVIWCAADCRPLIIGKSEAAIKFLAGLDPRYNPPEAKRTAVRILMAIREWMVEHTIKVVEQRRAELGPGSVHAQLDFWSSGLAKSSFGCMALTFVDAFMQRREVDLTNLSVDEIQSLVVSESPQLHLGLAELVLSFEAFPYAHTGQNIAEWYKGCLSRHSANLADVGITTLDGGANGLKAMKLLKQRWRYCIDHRLQRMILKALGQTGAPSKNAPLAALIKKNEAMAAAAHRSTKVSLHMSPALQGTGRSNARRLLIRPSARRRHCCLLLSMRQLTGELRAQQIKRGVPEGKTLCAAVGSDTRWLGRFMTVERNNVLMDDYAEVAHNRSRMAPTTREAEPEAEPEPEPDSDAESAPLPEDGAEIDFSTPSWVLTTGEQRINLELEGAMRAGADATLALEKSATVSNDQCVQRD